MMIKKISVSNFKSFSDIELELGNFNVLIGANASGKSNFLQIFKFLKDIADHGLNNAISLQGDVEYFRNTSIGASRNFSLQVVYTPKTKLEIIGENIGIITYEVIYEFAIEFSKRGREFKVSEDKLTQKLKFLGPERQKGKVKENVLGFGEIVISNVDGQLQLDLHLPETVSLADISPPFSKMNWLRVLDTKALPSKTLFLESPYFSLVDDPFEKLFSDISIYDFDPKLPKKGVSITGRTELEQDGSNLAIVLKNIIEDKEQKRKFTNLIQDLLPFIGDLRVEKFADKSLLFTLQETYSQGLYLPASFISDGTINITALIIALYFEKKPLIIFEEPERNIHPFLISKMVNMLEEASANKQIIVTTHNPEIIKYADLENILLISRNKEGFSTISRPGEKEELKLFLENEIGIEELYIQDLLRV